MAFMVEEGRDPGMMGRYQNRIVVEWKTEKVGSIETNHARFSLLSNCGERESHGVSSL